MTSGWRVSRTTSPADLVAELLDRFGDVELGISAMSAGELLHGCWRAESAERRARREEFVESLLAALPVVAITLPIMRIFAEVDATLGKRGTRLPAASRGSRSTIGRADRRAHAALRRIRACGGCLTEVASGSYLCFMRVVGLKVLKNRLSEYVRLAANGERVLVTDRDRVVAELGPPAGGTPEYAGDAVLADAVRQGWLRPPALPKQAPPPRRPVMSFEEMMGALDETRADRG